MGKISTPLAFKTAILIWANIVQISWVELGTHKLKCIQDSGFFGSKWARTISQRTQNETRCFTGLNLHFGAKTADLNWGNSESNYTGLTLKRNFFPSSYVDIVSIVCFGTKDYFSRNQFVRFFAHYRKKKIVFPWVLQSINNIFNCDSGSPPPPQNFLHPSAYVHWLFFPKDWLSSLRYLGLFYFSDRKDLHVIFLYVNQIVNRKISEFIARKLDFFTFNIPLTIDTALRSFENQINSLSSSV